jgi:hypothetical protein
MKLHASMIPVLLWLLAACGNQAAHGKPLSPTPDASQLADAASNADAGGVDCSDLTDYFGAPMPRGCVDRLNAGAGPCPCPAPYFSGPIDAGAGASCEVDTSDYAKDCQRDQDCMLAITGDLCTYDCTTVCPLGVISSQHQAAYKHALDKVPFVAPQLTCNCPALGIPVCKNGTCISSFDVQPEGDASIDSTRDQ